MEKKNLAWLKEDYIAHRGLHQKDLSVPENTISAFRLAIEQGYSIEFDINILKDGHVVVFHDHNLKRCFGIDKSLDQLTYEDIKDLTYKSGDHIPLLSEVLTFIDGRANLLIELKPQGDVAKLCEAFIKIIDHYKGTFAVFSFHPMVVYYFKKHRPHIIRGQISEYFKDNFEMSKFMKFLMKRLAFNLFTRPDFVSYGIYDMPNKYLDKYKKRGLTIISYAAKSQKEFDFVKTFYDNVVFEYFIPKK
jgi:glycerophosphoryl diester phosphodiesterase